MSSVPHVSQVPFYYLNQPNSPPRDPRSNPNWIPPWQRPLPRTMLHYVAYQLSRPPLNPHGLPEWALRPRGLDAGLLGHLSLGVDKNWKHVVNEMINRATSRHSLESTTEDGEFEKNVYDEPIQDENDEEEELDDDNYGAGENHGAGDESGNENRFVDLDDEEQSDEEEEEELSEGSESEDVFQYQGDESEEDGLEPVKRKKSRASNPRSSKTLPSIGLKTSPDTGDKTLPGMSGKTLSPSMTPPPPRGKAKRLSKKTASDGELDEVLVAIIDESGTRGQKKGNNRNSRFLKEQERLLAQFQRRNVLQPEIPGAPVATSSKRPHSDDESDSQPARPSKKTKTKFTGSLGHKNEPQTSALKRSGPVDDSNSDDLGIKSGSKAHPAKTRRTATEEAEVGANTEGDGLGDFDSGSESPEATRPSAGRQTMGPSHAPARSKAGASRGSIKKGKWADDEEQVLIDLMVAQREWEVANNVAPKKWLKDVKLYEKISRQLVKVGIERSSAACKNQWNRSAREKSGFDERPGNGTTRSLVCSEQKPRKEKERLAWK